MIVCSISALPKKAVELFTLLARSLSRLAYTDKNPQAVAAAFLLHFSAISGYRPRLSHCVNCGRRLEDEEIRLMDIEEGGLLCADCQSSLRPARHVTPAQVRWMRDILQHGIDKTDRPAADAPGALLGEYVETHMEKPLRHEGLWLM